MVEVIWKVRTSKRYDGRETVAILYDDYSVEIIVEDIRRDEDSIPYIKYKGRSVRLRPYNSTHNDTLVRWAGRWPKDAFVVRAEE